MDNTNLLSHRDTDADIKKIESRIEKFLEKFTNLSKFKKKNLRYALIELSKGMYYNKCFLRDYKKQLRNLDANKTMNPGYRIECMSYTLNRIRQVRRTMTFIMNRYSKYITDYTKLNEKQAH